MTISAGVLVVNNGPAKLSTTFQVWPQGERITKKLETAGSMTFSAEDEQKFRLKASGPADINAVITVTNSGEESLTMTELDQDGDPIEDSEVVLEPEESRTYTLAPGDGRNGVLKISGVNE